MTHLGEGEESITRYFWPNGTLAESGEIDGYIYDMNEYYFD